MIITTAATTVSFAAGSEDLTAPQGGWSWGPVGGWSWGPVGGWSW